MGYSIKIPRDGILLLSKYWFWGTKLASGAYNEPGKIHITHTEPWAPTVLCAADRSIGEDLTKGSNQNVRIFGVLLKASVSGVMIIWGSHLQDAPSRGPLLLPPYLPKTSKGKSNQKTQLWHFWDSHYVELNAKHSNAWFVTSGHHRNLSFPFWAILH